MQSQGLCAHYKIFAMNVGMAPVEPSVSFKEHLTKCTLQGHRKKWYDIVLFEK